MSFIEKIQISMLGMRIYIKVEKIVDLEVNSR
jgi:hypothetical protein